VFCFLTLAPPLCASSLFPYTTLFRSSENGREDAFRIGTRQGEIIGMADARRLDLDQHFAGAWALQLHGHDLEGLASLNGNRSTEDRKSTRLNSSHVKISYAVFCLKKK